MARITLVACVKQKLATESKAQDLYQSQLFKGCRAWAENPQNGDAWYILSARHGLLEPGKMIYPYDMTLASATQRTRDLWAEQTTEQLVQVLQPWDIVTVLAGKRYREPLLDKVAALLPMVEFVIPLEGKGIGSQLQWLSQANAKRGWA